MNKTRVDSDADVRMVLIMDEKSLMVSLVVAAKSAMAPT